MIKKICTHCKHEVEVPNLILPLKYAIHFHSTAQFKIFLYYSKFIDDKGYYTKYAMFGFPSSLVVMQDRILRWELAKKYLKYFTLDKIWPYITNGLTYDEAMTQLKEKEATHDS